MYMEPPFQVQSFNYNITLSTSPEDKEIHKMLASIKDMNANTICITWIVSIDGETGKITKTTDHEYYNATYDDIFRIVKMAQEYDLDVWIKPQYNTSDKGFQIVANYNPHWSGTEQATNTFFEEITQYSRILSELAEENNVKTFIIGAEHSGLENKNYDLWKSLIEVIRDNFHGMLTYASTGFPFSEWEGTAGADDVVFWDLLDFIGVDPYHPVSRDNLSPTDEEIYQSWFRNDIHYKIEHNLVFDYKAIGERFGKPVMITEIGYLAMDGANIHTWNMDLHAGILDLEEQAQLVNGVFRAFAEYNDGWLMGINWWGYHNIPRPIAADELWMKSSTFYTKPAQSVVTEWFGGQRQVYREILGTPDSENISGGYHHDVIWAGKGNDTISGHQGADHIFSGMGNDLVRGGSNSDVIFGNLGDDIIYGDADDDILYGGKGSDSIYGGIGDDFVSGDLGDDILNGGWGHDTFYFHAGHDIITDFDTKMDILILGFEMEIEVLEKDVRFFNKENSLLIWNINITHLNYEIV